MTNPKSTFTTGATSGCNIFGSLTPGFSLGSSAHNPTDTAAPRTIHNSIGTTPTSTCTVSSSTTSSTGFRFDPKPSKCLRSNTNNPTTIAAARTSHNSIETATTPKSTASCSAASNAGLAFDTKPAEAPPQLGLFNFIAPPSLRSTATASTNTEELHKPSIHLMGLCKQLHKYFYKQEFCDVILNTKEDEDGPVSSIQCHKVVLMAASKYFEEQFATDENLMDLSPLKLDVLKEILNYVYTGECVITDDTLEILQNKAVEWKIQGLALKCDDYALANVNCDNVMSFLRIASDLDRHGLRSKIVYFIRDHFEDLLVQNKTSLLSQENFYCVLDSDSLVVSSEDVVFDSVVQWVEGHSEEPDHSMLYGLIRFEHISKTHLTDVVLGHRLMQSDPQVEFVRCAVKHHINCVPAVKAKRLSTKNPKS